MGYIRDQTLSEGGRGFISIEDRINDKSKNLALYALRCNEKLIMAATTKLKPKIFINVQNKQEMEKYRLTKWKKKAVHGQFLREPESTDDGNRWEWLKRGELNYETESLLCADQEHALQVNAIKCSIDKTSDTPLC